VFTILEVFYTSPTFYLTTIFVLGLLVGSFLNVVIYRLPVMMKGEWWDSCRELLEIDYDTSNRQAFNLIVPRSRCQKCQHKITALENIPIVSYIFLKGKCSNCKNKISIRYPLVEFVSAITVTIVAVYFGVSMQALFGILLTWALIALTMIDFDHQLLPDDITMPLLWLGIIINLYDPSYSLIIDFHPDNLTRLESSIVGAILGYGILWTVYITFKVITGKEGMGHGDFKLLAALGAWLGWQALPLIIVLSSVVGAIVGISLMVLKSHDRSSSIPFGPYLAVAGWVAMLWGPYLISAYLNSVV
jgi:leader peptidase (prepilin peptidase) / N-methyltransferase